MPRKLTAAQKRMQVMQDGYEKIVTRLHEEAAARETDLELAQANAAAAIEQMADAEKANGEKIDVINERFAKVIADRDAVRQANGKVQAELNDAFRETIGLQTVINAHIRELAFAEGFIGALGGMEKYREARSALATAQQYPL